MSNEQLMKEKTWMSNEQNFIWWTQGSAKDLGLK